MMTYKELKNSIEEDVFTFFTIPKEPYDTPAIRLKKRINDYVKYVYSDDVLIVYKSGYKMKITLIPADSFVKAITKSLDEENGGINGFTKIWYRWENNNLRIRYTALMNMIKKLNLDYFDTVLNLEKVFENEEFINSITLLEQLLDEKIEDLI